MLLLCSLILCLGDESTKDLVPKLRAQSALTQSVFERAAEHKLQLLVSQPVEQDGTWRLVRHGFRVDQEYFYPASAIKLLAAVAALEKMEALQAELPSVSRSTPLAFHPLLDGDVFANSDESNLEGGAITLEHEIRKLFLVSDNPAFNRLYEFVGQDELNQRFLDKGYQSVRLLHRLSRAVSEEDNRRTPKIELFSASLAAPSTRTLEAHVAAPRAGSSAKGLLVGRGQIRGQELVLEPFDFSRKNAISLAELQEVLVQLARPEIELGKQPLRLSEASRTWLLEVASQYPTSSTNPRYEREKYPDTFGKFLLAGLCRVHPQEHWRISNKIGRAYGFSIENAYVELLPSQRAVFVTVALYTNANGILNDGVYEYEELADPFLEDLGEALARSCF